MKAKDLIKELQTVHPDTEIYIYESMNIASEYIVLKNACVTDKDDQGRVFLEDPGVENMILFNINSFVNCFMIRFSITFSGGYPFMIDSFQIHFNFRI